MEVPKTAPSYIESAAGVAVGGRSGLCVVTTATLFFLSIFLAPLAQTVGGGYQVADGVYLYPVIAPALVIVGSLMLPLVKEIKWGDMADSFSAYLTIVVTPLTVSITDGISAGFIAYSILKTAQGKFFETSPLTHVLALMFVSRYIFLV